MANYTWTPKLRFRLGIMGLETLMPQRIKLSAHALFEFYFLNDVCCAETFYSYIIRCRFSFPQKIVLSNLLKGL